MAIDVQKLEDRIDRVVAAGTGIDMKLGGVQFSTLVELMEFAKMMACSQLAVPPHLRGNPGACLAICTKALRNGFDPFALAEHSFAMSKEVEITTTNPNGGRSTQKEKVDTIAYDSYVIRAIINAHAPIKGGLKYRYTGDGEDRKCIVNAVRSDTGEVIEHESPTLDARKKAIGTSEKGYLKGSPLWTSKPDVQLGYDTARDLCRLHFPEVLMGWYDKDELEESVRAEVAKDITPASGLKDRLKGQGNRKGFHPDNTAAITSQPAQAADFAPITTKEPETVAVAATVVTADPVQAVSEVVPAEPVTNPRDELEQDYLPVQIDALADLEGADLDAHDQKVRAALAGHDDLIGAWNGHVLTRRRDLAKVKPTNKPKAPATVSASEF